MKLHHTWHCITCPAHGEGDDAEKQADKHMKATKHAVATRGTR